MQCIMNAFLSCFNIALKIYCRGTLNCFNEVLNTFQSITHMSELKACGRERKISFQMAPNCIQSTTNWKFYIYTFSVKYTVIPLL